MLKKPMTTIMYIFICVAFTVACEVLNNSIYGIDENFIRLLSFNPVHPFSHFGLGLLCSPFIHISFAHIATNLFFIIPMCLMIERKQSSLYLFSLMIILHFMTLLMLSLTSRLMLPNEIFFAGSSHLVIGLYTFWSIFHKKFSLLLIPTLIFVIGFWQGQNQLIHLAHAIAMIGGLLIATGNFFLHKNRP